MNWYHKKDGQFASKKSWKFKGITFILFFVGVFTVGHYFVEPAIEKANSETREVLGRVSKALSNDLSYVAGTRVEASEIGTDLAKAKEKTIDILEKCESGGHTWEEGFIRLDSNDKLSYGPLQWQKATVVHYIEKRDGRKITGLEAVEIALDREQSRALAMYVIFETDRGVESDWVICDRNNGIQARVDIIKELEN